MNQGDIGKFIAFLRKEKGFTQERFAEMLGVNNRSVSRWENGYCMPDLSLFPMIAEKLDVSVPEILSGERAENGRRIKEDAYLKNYKVLMEINRKEIFSEKISDEEKQDAVSCLLNGISCRADVIRYKKQMGVNPDTDCMYPAYYIPPYNGNKKLRLIQGYLPKTHILYANHYELEILRLLLLFEPANEKVQEMVGNTLGRLKKTCFGNSCPQGECVAVGISVLRFLAVAQPEDTGWIEKLVNPLGERFLSIGKGRAAVQNGMPISYLLMAFTDVNSEKTRALIAEKREWLLSLLRRGSITKKLSDGKMLNGRMPDGKMSDEQIIDKKILDEDIYHRMGKYILRKALGIFPE